LNRNSYLKSILSLIVSTTFLFGTLSSCSTAETANSKKVEEKKVTASSGKTALSTDTSKNTSVNPKEDNQLVVYYFMTSARCFSCHYIEEKTRAAINETFAEQLKSGRLVIKTINIEVSPNEHFVNDYKLYTKSVILSDTKSGKEVNWKNLDKVWQLIGNDQGFKEYIVKEVKTVLGA
jgi:hypothetical protein